MLEWRFNLPVEGMYWRTAGSCWREGPKNFSSTPRSRRPIWGADLRGGRMPRRDDIRKILIIGSRPILIGKARPDALLPNLGGQTGLNLSSALAREGILEEYGVKVIGVNVDAIKRGEDRQEFKNTMTRLGLDMPRSDIARSLEEAKEVVKRIGFPVGVRPAYTLGGTGGGVAYNLEEFQTIV